MLSAAVDDCQAAVGRHTESGGLAAWRDARQPGTHLDAARGGFARGDLRGPIGDRLDDTDHNEEGAAEQHDRQAAHAAPVRDSQRLERHVGRF